MCRGRRPTEARGTNGAHSTSQGRVRPGPFSSYASTNILSSKMVNVNARLPFNLHHKNLSSITNTADRHASTSSNSRSASSNRGRGLVPLSSTPHSHAQIQAHVGGPLTVVPSNTSLADLVTNPHAAGSRSSSMASRGTSASTHGHDSETSKGPALRSPVIHARLVRRPGSGIPGVGGAAAARRGRPKTKKSGSGDSSSSPTAAGPSSSRSEQQLQQAPSISLTNTEDNRTPHSAVPIIGGITDQPTLSISPASTSTSPGTAGDLELKLKNVGSLSVSWGQ
jgi:hypothetical protein